MLYASDERRVLEAYGERSVGYLAVSDADRAHIAIHDRRPGSRGVRGEEEDSGEHPLITDP